MAKRGGISRVSRTAWSVHRQNLTNLFTCERDLSLDLLWCQVRGAGLPDALRDCVKSRLPLRIGNVVHRFSDTGSCGVHSLGPSLLTHFLPRCVNLSIDLFRSQVCWDLRSDAGQSLIKPSLPTRGRAALVAAR